MSLKVLWKIFVVIVFSFGSLSCGKKSPEEFVSDAILQANSYLNNLECQKAITLLEGVGRQTSNAEYLVTLASAYACKGNYSTITYFANDIVNTSADSNSALGGLALYTIANDTIEAPFITDPTVSSLQTAIDILLYAGGGIPSSTNPTAARRINILGDKTGDVNSLAAYLILNLLGKDLYYYGNTAIDTTTLEAVKGSGTAFSNTCITNYSAAEALIQIGIDTGGVTGSCADLTTGHTELITPVSNANRKARLCQGVVLMNNLLEILPNILVDIAGTDLASISALLTSADAAKDDLVAAYPGLGSVLVVQSQSLCESDTAISLSNLESYFATVFEPIFL